MTVGQLRKELNKYPDSMDVFIAERVTEFTYGLVNSVRKEKITFEENLDFRKGKLAKETVIIIDEE
jgi:hypothetical protein